MAPQSQPRKDSFGERLVTGFIYTLIAAEALSIVYVVTVSLIGG